MGAVELLSELQPCRYRIGIVEKGVVLVKCKLFGFKAKLSDLSSVCMSSKVCRYDWD